MDATQQEIDDIRGNGGYVNLTGHQYADLLQRIYNLENDMKNIQRRVKTLMLFAGERE